MRPNYTISWNGHTLELGKRTRIMAILNVTPDSFSDGGKFFSIDNAVAQGERLVEDGADILDIGGESTRPFSDPVSAEDEIRRVAPVIEKLAGKIDVPISIDTTKAAVAKRAIDAGAAIINDVGALRLDPHLVDIAAHTGVPVIVMHMLGIPKTMQVSPVYGDLVGEIRQFLENAIARAIQGGVARSKIIFSPSPAQNSCSSLWVKALNSSMAMFKRLISESRSKPCRVPHLCSKSAIAPIPPVIKLLRPCVNMSK